MNKNIKNTSDIQLNSKICGRVNSNQKRADLGIQIDLGFDLNKMSINIHNSVECV